MFKRKIAPNKNSNFHRTTKKIAFEFSFFALLFHFLLKETKESCVLHKFSSEWRERKFLSSRQSHLRHSFISLRFDSVSPFHFFICFRPPFFLLSLADYFSLSSAPRLIYYSGGLCYLPHRSSRAMPADNYDEWSIANETRGSLPQKSFSFITRTFPEFTSKLGNYQKHYILLLQISRCTTILSWNSRNFLLSSKKWLFHSNICFATREKI